MKFSATFVLSVSAIGAGIFTYFTSLWFTKFYLELIPLILLGLLCPYFIRQFERKYNFGTALIITIAGFCLALSVFYIISELFPLPGLVTASRPSEHIMKFFIMLGISCGAVLSILPLKNWGNRRLSQNKRLIDTID